MRLNPSQNPCLATSFLEVFVFQMTQPQNDNKSIPENLVGHLLLCLQQCLENPGKVAEVRKQENDTRSEARQNERKHYEVWTKKNQSQNVVPFVFYF